MRTDGHYDNDTILNFGATAEVILCNPLFNQLLAAWDDTSVRAMLATKAEQRDERERLFSEINAVRKFIGFMQEFVVHAHKLQQPPDDMAQIDDPAVHDIYREDYS